MFWVTDLLFPTITLTTLQARGGSTDDTQAKQVFASCGTSGCWPPSLLPHWVLTSGYKMNGNDGFCKSLTSSNSLSTSPQAHLCWE